MYVRIYTCTRVRESQCQARIMLPNISPTYPDPYSPLTLPSTPIPPAANLRSAIF